MGISFDVAMGDFEPRLPLAVAASGGADSTALLAACARKWPGKVGAIHVHHGLQAAADGFEKHCRALCDRLGVPLAVRRVDARHRSGQSPEDAARDARYAALREAAHDPAFGWHAASIALAQHADDQVETLLLALSRGAGLSGLAGMRPHWQESGVSYHRPLLDVAGSEIRGWLAAQDIAWIEDPTNANEQLTRNRIRARLLPALAQAFPQYRDTFARSARHAAQAQSLLQEVAADDLRAVGEPPALASLRGLTRPRQANLLRHWLKTVHGQHASAAQLDELLDQVASCTTRGHDIRIKVGTGFVLRQGERLAFTL